MIEINSYEELKKYLQSKPIEKGEDYYIYLIDFKENGRSADVIINFFGEMSGLYRWTDDWKNRPFMIKDKYKIKAKNLTFNYDSDCEYIDCENLTIKKHLFCENVVVANRIECNDLMCNSVCAGSIESFCLTCKSLFCGHLKTRALWLDGKSFNYFTADNAVFEKEFKELWR